MCEWKGQIWASTSKGLYRVHQDEMEQVTVPILENDLITALYSGWPYALICGTYNGDLIFITQDEEYFCQANWSLHKDGTDHPTFFVNAVAQNGVGVWMGSLEKGLYMLDPETREFSNFSLQIDEDKQDLNVLNLMKGNSGEIWANTPRGLFYITKIYGDEANLQYVYSRKGRDKVYHMQKLKEGIFIATYKRNKTRIKRVKWNKNSFDYRVIDRVKLPDYISRHKFDRIWVKNPEDIWFFGPQTYHYNQGKFSYHPLPDSVYYGEAVRFLVEKNNLWLASRYQGVYKMKVSLPCDTFDEKVISLSKKDTLIELNTIRFERGDSTLFFENLIHLNSVAILLQHNPKHHVLIKGHTADDGDVDFLRKLSEARCRAVRRYLIRRGIDADRIRYVGLGASQLKNLENPKGAENRRVEMEILYNPETE